MRVTDKGREALATLHPAPVVDTAQVSRAIPEIEEAIRVLEVAGYRIKRWPGGYWQLGLGPRLTLLQLLARAEEASAR